MKAFLSIPVVLAAFLLLPDNAVCQRRVNPFELTPRLDSLQTGELSPSSDKLNGENTDSLFSSESYEEFDPADGSPRDITDPKFNPFEVDHVPLRKSKLAELEQKIDFSTALVSSTAKSNNFLIWFLLISAALLAIAVNAKSGFIGLMMRSVLNENMLKLLHREESQKVSVHAVLLYLIFCINAGSFLYLAVSRFGTAKGVQSWFMLLMGVVAVYSIKHFSLKIFGELFQVEKSTSLYSFTVMLVNLIIGLLLIPANLFIAFAPEKFSDFIFYLTLITIIILVVLRTIRGFFIASEFVSNRIFQLFIYLCAFEIAPVMILVKTAMKMVY
ncbi:MAG: DUF4271 domain-containing protein [Saprospiraceae bacterium]|nr:DUF4271 domain-containing protein [Saprospiraceae bacterium]